MSTQNHFTLPIPSDAVLAERIKASRRKVARWWECKNTSPVLNLILNRPDFPTCQADRMWPTPEADPDFALLAAEQMRWVHHAAFGGDAIPHVAPNFGKRGTPMVLSFFLGAQPIFGPHTIWYDPIITDIRDFDPEFDPDNAWFKKNLALFEELAKASPQFILPDIPGIGDYLTNLSGLRGVQDLIYDVMDSPQEIRRIREKMVPIFAEVYGSFAKRYLNPEEGTQTWLVWAPGTTYPVQCDFSTMMNPAQFREHIMPELEFLSGHLEYMCWHLDGPDEIKHLDALLESPHIKTIQWVPGAGQPHDCEPQWRPMIEKILASGRGVILHAYNLEEARTLIETYPAKGLQIICWDTMNEENVGKVERYFGEKMW